VFDIKTDKVLATNGYAYGEPLNVTSWDEAIKKVRDLSQADLEGW
jgi:hypothetical protein